MDMIREILDCINGIYESEPQWRGKPVFIEWSVYFVIAFINTCK